MDECQHAMEELRNIVEGISNLRDTAYAHYSLLVEQGNHGEWQAIHSDPRGSCRAV